MVRFMMAAAGLAIGVAAAAAQSDPVRERAELMYNMGGDFYGALNKMARGELAYDQAKVDDAFAKAAAAVRKLTALYPETAKGQSPDADYFATAKVWENKADFDARFAALAKALADNAPKAKNLDGLKDARAAVVEACGGCHENYRAKKS